MPQLDTVTYISSLFWIILTYLTYYILYVREVLPNLSVILKLRNTKEGLIDSMILKNKRKEELVNIRHNYLYRIYKKIWD